MSQRITIEIKDKIAKCLTELPIVCGNADYIIDFKFDEEWNTHDVKTAIFVVNGKATQQVFNGNECPVPVIQNTLLTWVGVFAGAINDGTLSTSTPALVKCIPCITDGDSIPAPPPDDVYNQIIELLNQYIEQGGGGSGGITKETDPTVPAWAKQAKKPTYSYSEITGTPEIPIVYEWAKKPNKPTYTAQEVGALPSNTPLFSGDYNDLSNKPTIPSTEGLATEEYADNASAQAVSQGITTHNVSQETHKDIRNLISELSNRLNAIADSDDKTLDQLSEIVAYIKANKALIESVTTSKVNVSDIVNDLETNVVNKPLSASQGVALKALINALGQSVSGLDEELDGMADTLLNFNENLSTLTEKANELEETAVSDIGSAVAEETNELTIELKDKNGKVIATTKVTLPTQEIPEVDLSGYVKKTDGIRRLYGTDGTASQATLGYNTSVVGSNIVQRNTDGSIQLPDTNENSNVAYAVNYGSMRTYVNDKIATVESIAKGANQAISYGNYQTLITTLNALPKDALKVGQNLYIVTVGVPDLWISGVLENSATYTYATDNDIAEKLKTNGVVQVGYYVLSALETQKVDMTDYAKSVDLDELEDTVADLSNKTNTLVTYGTTDIGVDAELETGKMYVVYEE